MFTGIVEEVGTILNITEGANSGSLTIAADTVLKNVELGDSIAVNGVCLTVTSFDKAKFTADAMPVTLDKTNLGELSPGDNVNLERALQLKSRLGGHLVSGHVDGLGTIKSINQDDNAILIEIEATEKVKKFIIREGSIAIDGISLTVAEMTDDGFFVSIIPHTAEETTLVSKGVGDILNLEADMIGKYLYNFWQRHSSGNKDEEKEEGKITKEFLTSNGFF